MTLNIKYPDDFHIHLRDHELLKYTVPLATEQFKKVLVMPNTIPPILTYCDALSYYNRIMKHVPQECKGTFKPLMTLYLTENTEISELIKSKESGLVVACKLYPKGATTNSNNGVTDIKNIFPQLKKMEEIGLILCIHGEVIDKTTDIFEREALFIKHQLPLIYNNFPSLKIILEHITTKEGVNVVLSRNNMAATITPQHLMFNRNQLLDGGVRPHYYCLPILKTESDRLALVEAAISGNPKFFAGTDSAPHTKEKKESDCGCAGCFSGVNAIEFYTSIFDKENKLENLERFMSVNGSKFYGFNPNTKKIKLIKKTHTIPDYFKDSDLVPFCSKSELDWTFDYKDIL